MIALLQAAKKAKELKNLVDECPLDFFRPSLPQRRVLESEHPITLFRAANQLGKTYVGAAECLYMMKGYSPYKDLSHIKPLSQGGLTDEYNCILECRKCHMRRHHQL